MFATASLGPAPVIRKDDLVRSGQAAQPAGEDSNRVGQHLGIPRIGDGAFHGRGIGSDLPSPFQSLALRPLHQEPVDLLPGSGLNPADVVLEAGGTGGPLPRESSEATKALRVAQEERQLGVGQLMPVLEDGRAQDLLCGETRSPLARTGGVTQIV